MKPASARYLCDSWGPLIIIAVGAVWLANSLFVGMILLPENILQSGRCGFGPPPLPLAYLAIYFFKSFPIASLLTFFAAPLVSGPAPVYAPFKCWLIFLLPLLVFACSVLIVFPASFIFALVVIPAGAALVFIWPMFWLERRLTMRLWTPRSSSFKRSLFFPVQ